MNSLSKTFSRSRSNGASFDAFEIEYDVQLAANIIKARVDRGLTQDAVAKLMKTQQPAIARAESGDRPPSHKFVKKFARSIHAKVVPTRFILLDGQQIPDSGFAHCNYSMESDASNSTVLVGNAQGITAKITSHV